MNMLLFISIKYTRNGRVYQYIWELEDGQSILGLLNAIILFPVLYDRLIVCCLISSRKYIMHIHVENKFNNIKNYTEIREEWDDF
jgi:hypothetical protein